MAITAALLLAAMTPGPAAGVATSPPVTTLDGALARAHQANARLPAAALDAGIAEQDLREAQAQRRVVLSAEGELWLAPAGGYDPTVTDLGEERLQVIAEKTLYDGGAARAQERGARADVRVARARYRQLVADVDEQVRESFAGVLAAERESEIREEAMGRLERYLGWLEQRSRSGQPVTADRLNARVRLAADRAALAAARGRAAEARSALAVLMGLPPLAPLVLAAPPAPRGPPDVATPVGEPALEPLAGVRSGLPDVAAARQQAAAAAAEVAAARAERAPEVRLRADAGLWGSDPLHAVPDELAASHPGADAGDRLRPGLGYSLTVSVHLPLLDTGGVAARVARAELVLEQAERGIAEAEIQADLERSQARRALADTYEQYRLLGAAMPVARDAALDAESRYRGGTAGYLEVLDAWSSAVDIAVQRVDAELSYRQAEARLLRWEGAP